MFLFRIKNIRISVDVGFLTVLAAISLTGGRLSGYSFAACIIHELGHLMQIYISGDNVKSVAFNVSGIKIVRNENRLNSFYSDMAVLLSGPMANIAIALFLLILNQGCFTSFIAVNIVLGIFNLLPFGSLDGGSVLKLLVYNCFSPDRSRSILCFLRFFNLCLCVLAACLWWFSGIGNISIPIMIVYLFITELTFR